MFKTRFKLRIMIQNLLRIPKFRYNSSEASGDRSNTYCGNKNDGVDSTGGTGKSSDVSSDSNPSGSTMYECRKYGHTLPCDNVTPNFETLPNIPTGIFRCTAGEVLGRGANKCTIYQNPEYFSFHHMTFYDLHMVLRPFRQRCPKTGRKK